MRSCHLSSGQHAPIGQLFSGDAQLESTNAMAIPRLQLPTFSVRLSALRTLPTTACYVFSLNIHLDVLWRLFASWQ